MQFPAGRNEQSYENPIILDLVELITFTLPVRSSIDTTPVPQSKTIVNTVDPLK